MGTVKTFLTMKSQAAELLLEATHTTITVEAAVRSKFPSMVSSK
jgi:hypothetical protein